MHPHSHQLMTLFYHRYVRRELAQLRRLLDVGSMDSGLRKKNGTYRGIFAKVNEYVGVDLAAGLSVDVVLTDPYQYPFPEHHFDLAISGQALEHMQQPWRAVCEMSRVLRPGGLMCLIAPWRWEIHRYPIDCFRILPDGMHSLMTNAGIDVLECFESDAGKNDGSGDTCGIGRKRAT